MARAGHGIGGSQVSSALGLNPWQPAIQLWLELMGEAPELPDNPAMKWGRLLEPVVREEYAAMVGFSVEVPAGPVYHPTADYRRATVDGLVVDGGERLWGLEIKTANARAGDDWGPIGSDEVPLHYLLQCAWYMHVLGLDRWDVAVLIGGQDFRCYTLNRDMEFESRMVEQVDAFWTNHVLTREAPAPDHTREFRQYLERRYPSATEEYVRADESAARMLERVLIRQAAMVELEQQDHRDKNILCSMIGEASGLETPYGRVHWKPTKGRTIVDWEAVARELASHLSPLISANEILDATVATHTRLSKSSRSLRLPRFNTKANPAWQGRTPLQLAEDNEIFKGAILGPGGNLGLPE